MTLTIGLLGGIASGKSTVGRLLEEQGAALLDADQAASAALQTPEVLEALRARWGEAVVDRDGGLNRRALAERVFGPEEQTGDDRRFLEGLIHPRVREALRGELVRRRAAGHPVAVLDIPLLLEAGWADECDLLLMVDTPEAARLDRARERGWGAQELAWREAAQMPISNKKRLANAVIANSDSQEKLRQNVLDFWRRHVAPRLR